MTGKQSCGRKFIRENFFSETTKEVELRLEFASCVDVRSVQLVNSMEKGIFFFLQF